MQEYTYTKEEREIISAALFSYANVMKKRVESNDYGFYKNDHDRVVKQLLWEVEHMKDLAKRIGDGE